MFGLSPAPCHQSRQERPTSAEPHVPMFLTTKSDHGFPARKKRTYQSMQPFFPDSFSLCICQKAHCSIEPLHCLVAQFPNIFFFRQETRTFQGALDGGHQNIDAHGVADRSCSSIGRKSFGRLGLQHSFANLVGQPLKPGHLLRQQSTSECWQVEPCLLAPCFG